MFSVEFHENRINSRRSNRKSVFEKILKKMGIIPEIICSHGKNNIFNVRKIAIYVHSLLLDYISVIKSLY